jgi:hypothetical protein
MEHIILSIHPLADWKLRVRFLEGVTKEYSCKPLFLGSPLFSQLAADEEAFQRLAPKTNGTCVYWNDYLGITAADIWDGGTVLHTAMDGLVKESDVSRFWWGRNEKQRAAAIQAGELIEEVDFITIGGKRLFLFSAIQRVFGPMNGIRFARHSLRIGEKIWWVDREKKRQGVLEVEASGPKAFIVSDGEGLYRVQNNELGTFLFFTPQLPIQQPGSSVKKTNLCDTCFRQRTGECSWLKKKESCDEYIPAVQLSKEKIAAWPKVMDATVIKMGGHPH